MKSAAGQRKILCSIKIKKIPFFYWKIFLALTVTAILHKAQKIKA
jgi:hypothetical protein